MTTRPIPLLLGLAVGLGALGLAAGLAAGGEVRVLDSGVDPTRAPGVEAVLALAQDPSAPEVDVAPELGERDLARLLKLSPLAEPPLDATNRFDGDPRAEALGRYLFFDARLSRDGTIACATCHDPALAFSDGKPVAVGLAEGTRRTPSLLNAAYGRWYYHDGRSDTLWAQALKPMEASHEMGGDRVAIARRVFADTELRAAVERLRGPLPPLDDRGRFPAHARPDGASPEAAHAVAWAGMAEADREAVNQLFSDLGKFLAAFERRLVSRDSAFDRFVEGLREGDAQKRAALSASAQRGVALYLGRGRCRLCHNGPNFTDGEFHSLGLAARGGGMPEDAGRYEGVPQLLADEFNAAGAYSDAPDGVRARQLRGLVAGPANWGEFKTPSLRDVDLRAPYMHAGQFAELADVLNFYSTLEGAAPQHQHQEQVLTALALDEGELTDLDAFLRSLRGAPLGDAWTTPPVGVPSSAEESAGEHAR